MTRQSLSSNRPSAGPLDPLDVALHEDRYDVQQTIGRGGMATVFEVIDKANGKRVALKRLQSTNDPVHQRRNLALFEREYHTLAQLAHPRVVEVSDFGVDRVGAYYTMELLQGRDLQQLARMPWRQACVIARDVCSALSLIHSRRLVHRDVSPRNVRCTDDGRAKLLDFGAVAAMGPNKLLVGTPPCCAPETMNAQALDGRTDLYALGATLYYLLVGSHAYVARHFSALPDAWQHGFARPSELVADIPEALDVLVLDLLRLEPDARPANAAEVMQRLAAIDGSSASDEPSIARAYLSSPVLVGRQENLARISRRVRSAISGAGRSIALEGRLGVGRSRLLDAALLDATLLGAVVVRADADDAVSGDYGVMRALAKQLLQTMPLMVAETIQPHRAVLMHAIPELASSEARLRDSPPERTRVQTALCQWLRELSHRHPLVVAVDDVHRSDEPSAAVLATLAADIGEHAMCLIVSAPSDVEWSASVTRKPLLEASTRITLKNLAPDTAHELLQSLFGAVPNLSVLTHHANRLCDGNPRDLMWFAQHFVERGVVRYEAGIWTLPAEIDALELPTSIAQTLEAHIALLSDSARELASALAMCPEQRFNFAECAQLAAATPSSVMDSVAELTRANVVRQTTDDVTLSQPSFVAPLCATLNEARCVTLHRRLAEIFDARAHQPFMAVRHWMRAGDVARALDQLLTYVRDENRRALAVGTTSRLNPIPGWKAIYEQALKACDELKRPRREKMLLLLRIAALNSLYAIHDPLLLSAIFDALRLQSGLSDWNALDPSLAPSARLKLSLQAARRRYDATPEDERVHEPGSAIRELASVTFGALGAISPTMNLAYLESLPDIRPFAALSPAVHVVSLLVEAMRDRLTGHIERAMTRYVELIEAVEKPGGSGLSPGQVAHFCLGLNNVQATVHAASGRAACLPLCEKLEGDPHYGMNGLIVRMLHAELQGDATSAEDYRERVSRARIQTGQTQANAGLHLGWEVDAHVLAEDLTRLRHAIDEVEPLAQRHPDWRPVLRYASAEYQRIRGASAKALSEIAAARELAQPGRHLFWANIACSHALILHELGRDEEALATLDEPMRHADEELGVVADRLRLVQSLINASLQRPQAADEADAVIAHLSAGEVTGLHLGFAYEVRARIALVAHDDAGFEQHLARCREIYCAHRHPALLAKVQRLENAQRRGRTRIAQTPPTSDTRSDVASHASAALEACADDTQRGHVALALLIARSHASAGVLCMLEQTALKTVAEIGQLSVTSEMRAHIELCLRSQSQELDTTCTDAEPDTLHDEWRDGAGRPCHVVVLSHVGDEGHVVNGVALLGFEDSVSFAYPAQLAAEISRAWTNLSDHALPTLVS